MIGVQTQDADPARPKRIALNSTTSMHVVLLGTGDPPFELEKRKSKGSQR